MAGYYEHNAGADFLYKLLMLGDEVANLSPVTDTVKAVTSNSGKSSGSKTANAQSVQDNGGNGGDSTNTSPTSPYSPGGTSLSPAASKAVDIGVSIGSRFAGVPGPVASLFGDITGMATSGKGVTPGGVVNSLTNIGLNTALPGLGSVLSALGFNPAQGMAEALGIGSQPTPGFEGGFFGTQGVGSGISAPASQSVTPGYSSADLGGGVSPGAKGGKGPGISGEVGVALSDLSGLAAALASAISDEGKTQAVNNFGLGVVGEQLASAAVEAVTEPQVETPVDAGNQVNTNLDAVAAGVMDGAGSGGFGSFGGDIGGSVASGLGAGFGGAMGDAIGGAFGGGGDSSDSDSDGGE